MDPRAVEAAATLHPLFRRSVVQILAQKMENRPRRRKKLVKSFHGTGFIIHRKVDENRLLVMTCWHVIDGIKSGQKLVVRLPGTTLDCPAYRHEYNEKVDIQVISVHVPAQQQLVAQFPPVTFSPPPAPKDITVGTIVALIGYYNPINFPVYVGLDTDARLFATEPSAFGGCIVGPEEVTATSGNIIQHNCFGIRGSSGSPLIHFDTEHVIGVFSSLTETIGESVSTECVRRLLGAWLERNEIAIDDNDTVHQRIQMCAELY